MLNEWLTNYKNIQSKEVNQQIEISLENESLTMNYKLEKENKISEQTTLGNHDTYDDEDYEEDDDDDDEFDDDEDIDEDIDENLNEEEDDDENVQNKTRNI